MLDSLMNFNVFPRGVFAFWASGMLLSEKGVSFLCYLYFYILTYLFLLGGPTLPQPP